MLCMRFSDKAYAVFAVKKKEGRSFMKTSKKVCALLLVVCLLCTVIPAAARTITTPVWLPEDQGGTLTIGNAEMQVDNQVFVRWTDPELSQISAGNTLVGSKLSGSFSIADKTYEFSNVTINESGETYVIVYATHLFYASETFKEAMKAAQNITDYETDDNGEIIMANSGTEANAFKRNLKRFILTELGQDYSQMSSSQLENAAIRTTGTFQITVPISAVEIGNLPEGTIFMATSLIKNDVPASGWQNFQGIYQQKDAAADSGIDGPWVAFVAPESGTYNVWMYKRDRQDSPDQRDIYLDVSGTELKFEQKINPETGSKYAPTAIGYYWEPEYDDKTVELVKGQKVYIRILAKTGNYAGAYGIAFVPAALNVKPDTAISEANFKVISQNTIAPHTDSTLVARNVTVNGVETVATEKIGFTAFPQIKRYDMTGNFIMEPTVFDAIVAADDGDDSYSIQTEVLDNYKITVNGKTCSEPQRTVAQENDVITVEEFVIDKTNFLPIAFGTRITGNGSVGASDALAAYMGECNMKFVTGPDAASSFYWPIDITQPDALQGCYINGYAKVTRDFVGGTFQENNQTLSYPDTTGDDRLVTVYVKDMEILHSAVRESDGRLEIGVKWSTQMGIQEVDGLTYIEPDIILSGRYQSGWYTKDGLYITNASSKAEVEVTAQRVAEGQYILSTNKTLPICLVAVTYDELGNVVSTKVENKILDFAQDPLWVTVEPNQKIYVWEGTFLTSGTSLKPLCAPLTR